MLSSNYTPETIEKKWQESWQKSGLYCWDSSRPREEVFVIDTPPPTVSGMLHMGHVFSYTQADFIARFQRMRGKTIFYPIGFDDNGLPTERLVEKINNIKASHVSKQDFRKMCYDVIEEAELEFRKLFESLALSFDWGQLYQTISDSTAKISQMSFLDLYHKGLLYKKHAPTFWDIVDKTAIAQTEIEDKEKTTIFYEIKFQLKTGEDLIIATTRPELIPACVAVFYHPDDSRFKNLPTQEVIIPIFDFAVPLLADQDVDIEKGTGVVMCCTFGDIQDIQWWQRHNLETKNCITLEGKMQNALILDGLNVNAARQKIVELLHEKNLIVGQTEIKHHVKCAERSGAPLEIIPTSQWYISILDYKNELLAKANECNWYPQYMKVRLENWIHGLNQDWCISRQRYFGVHFPVWYSKRKGEEGKVLLPEIEQLPVDPSFDLPKGYRADEVLPETDIMDTWATSSLTPQISSHALTEKFAINLERHNKLYPADLRIQSHEIIRTWAFCTVVKSHHHADSIPWKNVMISGWCLSKDGQKMSKSKGNIVTPQNIIMEKSADIIRYWASCSKLGADIIYSEDAFKIGKKLINKIWNAAKFLCMHLNAGQHQILSGYQDVKSLFGQNSIRCDIDFWILSKLYKTIEKATYAFNQFEYSDARQVIEEFFWKDFCDNYLELVKVRIYDSQNKYQDAKKSAIYTMQIIFYTILRLFAPFIPHVTEELNHIIFTNSNSLHGQNTWPELTHYKLYDQYKETGDAIIKLLELVRKYKSLSNLSLNQHVRTLEIYSVNKLSDSLLEDLKNAAQAEQINHCDQPQHHFTMSDCNNYGVNLVI